MSSAVQNAPQEQILQGGSYGLGMNAPLLENQGPSKPEITKPEKNIPVVSTGGGFEYSKPSNPMGQAMGGYSADGGSSWDSAF